ARLETSLVCIRARIAYILEAVGLGKEDAQTDTARDFGMRRVETLGAGNGGCELDHVVEWSVRALRIGGRRLHDLEQRLVLLEKRLIVGIEIRRRKSESVRPADSGGKRVGQIFIGAYHVVAGEIERLTRQIRQRLLRF